MSKSTTFASIQQTKVPKRMPMRMAPGILRARATPITMRTMIPSHSFW